MLKSRMLTVQGPSELTLGISKTTFGTDEELTEVVLSYLHGKMREFYNMGIREMIHHLQIAPRLTGIMLEKLLASKRKV